ncbi:MAG: hypothetical protein ACRCXZ_03100 [Patescibacteria group bacterium]
MNQPDKHKNIKPNKTEAANTQKEKKEKVNTVLTLIQIAKSASRLLPGSASRRSKEIANKIKSDSQENAFQVYTDENLSPEEKATKFKQIEVKKEKNLARLDRIKSRSSDSAYRAFEKSQTDIAKKLETAKSEKEVKKLEEKKLKNRVKLDQRLEFAKDRKKRSNLQVKNTIKEKLNAIKEGVRDSIKEKAEYVKKSASKLKKQTIDKAKAVPKEVKLASKLVQIKSENVAKATAQETVKAAKATAKATKEGAKKAGKAVAEAGVATVDAGKKAAKVTAEGAKIAGAAVVGAGVATVDAGKKVAKATVDGAKAGVKQTVEFGENVALDAAVGVLDLTDKATQKLQKAGSELRERKAQRVANSAEINSAPVESNNNYIRPIDLVSDYSNISNRVLYHNDLIDYYSQWENLSQSDDEQDQERLEQLTKIMSVEEAVNRRKENSTLSLYFSKNETKSELDFLYNTMNDENMPVFEFLQSVERSTSELAAQSPEQVMNQRPGMSFEDAQNAINLAKERNDLVIAEQNYLESMVLR